MTSVKLVLDIEQYLALLAGHPDVLPIQLEQTERSVVGMGLMDVIVTCSSMRE
jgi:hypothetical protein